MMRIGHGYDVHRLVQGRELIIGGVKIDYPKGLLGHSDADVLTHAIIDSLLGASGLGDIGGMFPDDNEEYLNTNSLGLLRLVTEKISKLGYKIINIDSTVVAQEPKLSKHMAKIRQNIARVCEISENLVNVKATTEEGLGFTGDLQGISSFAVCLIEQV